MLAQIKMLYRHVKLYQTGGTNIFFFSETNPTERVWFQMLLPTEPERFLIRESPFTDSSSRERICSDCTRER